MLKTYLFMILIVPAFDNLESFSEVESVKFFLYLIEWVFFFFTNFWLLYPNADILWLIDIAKAMPKL
jgi:hypothetical protein